MKPSEMRDLTAEELEQRYDDTRKELFNLRIQQSTGQIEKATRIRVLRRDVARILTLMRERAKAK
jgi:large subunit ribosomal protein L29